MPWGLPPMHPGPMASEEQVRQYYKNLKEYWSWHDRINRIVGSAVITLCCVVLAIPGYMFYQIIASGDGFFEGSRQQRLADNRAAISSCIQRGGYVIENRWGELKECRGVQRPQ